MAKGCGCNVGFSHQVQLSDVELCPASLGQKGTVMEYWGLWSAVHSFAKFLPLEGESFWRLLQRQHASGVGSHFW